MLMFLESYDEKLSVIPVISMMLISHVSLILSLDHPFELVSSFYTVWQAEMSLSDAKEIEVARQIKQLVGCVQIPFIACFVFPVLMIVSR